MSTLTDLGLSGARRALPRARASAPRCLAEAEAEAEVLKAHHLRPKASRPVPVLSSVATHGSTNGLPSNSENQAKALK